MIKEIKRLSKEGRVDKETRIRRLIAESLREYKIKRALELYREGKVSLWKAAEIARITYREALEELRKRNITFRYDLEDLEVDIGWALK